MARNQHIQAAVEAALDNIDRFTAGATITTMDALSRTACDRQLQHRSGSVRLATLFLTHYGLNDPSWEWDTVPTGIRGKYGDKLIGNELQKRGITLHNAITAFGENLGWKGNVTNVRLSNDPRFAEFAAFAKQLSTAESKAIADYLAYRFAESRTEVKPLPPVGRDVLTFARAKQLLFHLYRLPTEGHVPQFIVAALLKTHRQRFGREIHTHHPHAADKFDRSAGDIEEFHDGDLAAAYEVTVRPDWKNRVSDFVAKMDGHGLRKYVIFASDVNSDEALAEPARLIVFLKPYERDLAVVDLQDFFCVMAAELTAAELREAVNQAYTYLCHPKLCGRDEFQAMYRAAVDDWLDH